MKIKAKRIVLGTFTMALTTTAPIVAVVSCGKEEDSSKLFTSGEVNMKAIFKTMEDNIKREEIQRVPWITSQKNKEGIEKEWNEYTKLTLEMTLELPNITRTTQKRLEDLSKHFPGDYRNKITNKMTYFVIPSKSNEEYKNKIKKQLKFIGDYLRYGTVVLYNPTTQKEIYKRVYSKELRKEVLKYSEKTVTRVFNDANDYGKILVDLWTNPGKAIKKYSTEQLKTVQEHFVQTLNELKRYTRELSKAMFPSK